MREDAEKGNGKTGGILQAVRTGKAEEKTPGVLVDIVQERDKA